MTWAIFKIMALRLWRDRGALILALILPGVIYVVFASIFTTASGGDLDLTVGASLQAQTPANRGLLNQLADADGFTVLDLGNQSLEVVTSRVRVGTDDVAIIFTGDVATLGPSAITIVEEPGRIVASRVLKGSLTQLLVAQAGRPTPQFRTLSTSPTDTEQSSADTSVAYYIGAVAIMFVLFALMQAAALALDERRFGIQNRLMLGLGASTQVFLGRFAFLATLGFVQCLSICIVAQIVFDVAITQYLASILVACGSVAVFSAGLALFVSSISRTPAQMHATSTFLVLILSAVGGSMVPRFMMPGWLQDISRFTPNAYAIDGFYGILARDQSLQDLWPVWCILYGGGAILALLAAILSHRFGTA